MSEAEASRLDPVARPLATTARISREGGIGSVTLPADRASNRPARKFCNAPAAG
jgi:hypothetical protein